MCRNLHITSFGGPLIFAAVGYLAHLTRTSTGCLGATNGSSGIQTKYITWLVGTVGPYSSDAAHSKLMCRILHIRKWSGVEVGV